MGSIDCPGRGKDERARQLPLLQASGTAASHWSQNQWALKAALPRQTAGLRVEEHVGHW
jgi:hypothetical protein